MNGISLFITSFCGSCVLIGALYILCPDSAMSKSVKYALSLVFVISVITAAAAVGRIDFSFDRNAASVPSADKLATESARYAYSYALEKEKINFSEITVCTDKTDDGSIIISKVIIYSDANKEDIFRALGEAAENYDIEVRTNE